MKNLVTALLLVSLFACKATNEDKNTVNVSANNGAGKTNTSFSGSEPVASTAAFISQSPSAATADVSYNTFSTKTEPGSTHFGVIVNKSEGVTLGPPGQIKVARYLGLHYVRTRISMDKWKGSDDGLDKFKQAGLNVVLNVNYQTPSGTAVPFPTDMNDVKQKLNSILSKYRPALVVIENEEDNKGYHSGGIENYFDELKAGIEVAHSKGLQVTNGGITSPMLALLIYDDLAASGRKDDAYNFASKAFPDNRLAKLAELANSPMVKQKLAEGNRMLSAYKQLDLDYVNFHWYLPLRGIKGAEVIRKIDPQLLDYVVAFIKRKTGKTAITTEIGQLDPSPKIVTNTLQRCYNLKIPYVIWFSGDGGEGKAVALQNSSGELRENGKAFKDFIDKNNAGN